MARELLKACAATTRVLLCFRDQRSPGQNAAGTEFDAALTRVMSTDRRSSSNAELVFRSTRSPLRIRGESEIFPMREKSTAVRDYVERIIEFCENAANSLSSIFSRLADARTQSEPAADDQWPCYLNEHGNRVLEFPCWRSVFLDLGLGVDAADGLCEILTSLIRRKTFV